MFFPKIPTRTVFSSWFRRPENHLVPYNICIMKSVVGRNVSETSCCPDRFS
jgi:hypothetical protein